MKSSNDKVAIQLSFVAGRDYPRTYREFAEMFPDDEGCAASITGPIIETDVTHGYKWSRFQQIETRRS